MADFCNKCSTEIAGDTGEAEIDILKLSESLAPDTYIPVLCEGCGMRAVGKTDTGETLIAFKINEIETGYEVQWISYAEWAKA
jgi:hypothetical protein